MDPLEWLLDSDPAIRWQVMRDLTGASPADIAAERARVPRVGIGAQILACQQPDGSWTREGKPKWLSTLFTLLLLRSTGADPADPAIEATVARLQACLRWNDQPGFWDLRPGDFQGESAANYGCKPGGNDFFEGEEEPCINGGVLALGAWFRRPSETLALRLLGEQLQDGGWNCEAPRSSRSSFHTTICVLEGLLEYEHAAGAAPEVSAARYRGEEYLRKRALFRRLSNGEIVNPEFLRFAFPPRYCYDVLRALDYFRSAGAPPDDCFHPAIQVVRSRRLEDGRWLLDESHTDVLTVPFSESVGEPSRWNTLRAMRVLRWYGER